MEVTVLPHHVTSTTTQTQFLDGGTDPLELVSNGPAETGILRLLLLRRERKRDLIARFVLGLSYCTLSQVI